MTGWAALDEAVAQARALVAAAAPDAEVAAEGEAYVARVATAVLADAFLGHLLREDGLARALPTRGGPNPDYRMLHAPVDVARRYRLEGRLNGAERIGVGLYAPGADGAIVERGYAVLDPRTVGPDGRFGLDIAADAHGPGTLTLREGCRVLLIRIVQRDPAGEPARLRLTGGVAVPGLALATGTADGALAMAAGALVRSVRDYLRWTAAVQATPNRLAAPPPDLAEAVNAEPETQYLLGSFDLAADEWLEVSMPAGLPGYWSLHAYDHWFEHLQTPGVHDANAVPGADGRIAIRIGPALPASPANRIDTLGRRRGALICRIVGADPLDRPPVARLCRIADAA